MPCEQAHCYQVNFFCLCIQLFFQNNQGGEETTAVDYIGFIGSPLDTTNMDDFKRVRFRDLPHTQTSLFWWNCARKGRREGDNGRDGASPAVCTLPMVSCGSSPVTCFALASAMRKTKRLRRRLFHDSKPINHVRINYEVAFSHHTLPLLTNFKLNAWWVVTVLNNIDSAPGFGGKLHFTFFELIWIIFCFFALIKC